jgi:type I restriction enzyme, S subunit
MGRYPLVEFGQVGSQRKGSVTIDEGNTYKRCRVRLHAKGIVERDRVLGAEIKTKTQQVCKTGEFLVAEIDAKVGGFGIVPDTLDGAIVSSHYFLFSVDEARLDLRFLDYYIQTNDFRSQVEAQGSTNYAAIRPDDVLGYRIPLPPLAEQRQIVKRIEEIAARDEEARRLRQEAAAEASQLLASAREKAFEQALSGETLRLDRAADLERGKFSHRPRNEPRFFGGDHPWIQIAEIEGAGKWIRSYSQTLNDDGLAISRKFPKGTVLISIAATIGAVGILGFDCCFPDSIVGVTPKPEYDSEFIYHYLCYLRTDLERVAPQSAQKNINLKILSPLPVPVLDPNEQQSIVHLLDRLESKIEELVHEQAQAAAELDALMPAVLDRAFKGELL